MSKLDELLQEYCPDGVEYKCVDAVCLKMSSGGTPNSKRSDYYGGEIPWLRTQEVDFRAITKTGMSITEEGLNNSSAKWIPPHCVIVAMYGATVGKVGWTEIPLTTNQACCNLEVDEEQADYKYIYYCLANQYEYIKSLGQGSQTNINAKIVKNLEVPLPPLSVQREIVRILDSFTELTANLAAELAAELAARKKQYEYYRDELLTFGDGVKWKTIGEVSSFRRGSFPQPYGNKEWYDGEGAMPFVQVADIADNMKLVNDTNRKISSLAQPKSVFAPKGSIIISLQGSIGRIAVTQYDAYIDRTVAIFKDISEEILPKYFVYQLQRVFSIKEKTARGSTIKTITKEEFTNFPISIPDIATQQRIIDILDKFDSITSDISVGLPAEITARQKQYEYYRDKLLSFRRLEVS